MQTHYKIPKNICTCEEEMVIVEQIEKEHAILFKQKCECGNTGVTLMRSDGTYDQYIHAQNGYLLRYITDRLEEVK